MTQAAAPTKGPAARRGATAHGTLQRWLDFQVLNVGRHASALRPFGAHEFGREAQAPTAGHVQAVNALLRDLQTQVQRSAQALAQARARSGQEYTGVLSAKEQAHASMQAAERVWDFYFELFGQRQSRFGPWLHACDQVALDCYQHTWTNLGAARSIPAPPPLTYVRTGLSPATFRRGVRMGRLGRLPNPFPLIELPYHRLINPWTLGAVLHEVSHNLQADLDLMDAVPRQIHADLTRAGAPKLVAETWARWNRESFADLSGLLLGGPGVVGSLMDVVGRSPQSVMAYSPEAVHPLPYLRVLLSCALLRRMGFEEEAGTYGRAWKTLYPQPRGIPAALLSDVGSVLNVVVNAVCYTPYAALGRPLADVNAFGPRDQRLVEEAAGRLARGTDPGVVPERYLIGAVRLAAERRLASPGTLTEHFYRELSRR